MDKDVYISIDAESRENIESEMEGRDGWRERLDGG